MRNSLKIARWEIMRNLKQRSFWVSMLLTPLIFSLFFIVPALAGLFARAPEPLTLYVRDELGIWSAAESERLERQGEWSVVLVHGNDEEELLAQLEQSENALYLALTEQVLDEGRAVIYANGEVGSRTLAELNFIDELLDEERLRRLGITGPEAERLLASIEFELVPVSRQEPDPAAGSETRDNRSDRLLPAAFAGLILLSVILSGMMIFQSAAHEKKEKLSEILLSSVTAGELMQGKILGYFSLGLLQVFVWLALTIPLVYWRMDFPLLSYLFVPELVPLLFYAVAGYLLFASLFVAMGATVEDIASASNFQGLVVLIPWLPIMFFAPVVNDPSGTLARIVSYFPLTTPGIMLIRLAVLDEWPWHDIFGTSLILLLTIWLMMKLAGKIFRVGMLLYGKNASPAEIWRWLRS